jgi:flagellar biosynthesis protein FliR
MNLDFTNLMTPLLTIGLRVSGLMLFAPLFGSAAIPGRIKAVLVIAVTAVLYPALGPRVPAVDVTRWPLVVIHESLIGIALGMAANLLFDAVQTAGQILSIQMGYSLVNILDPQNRFESTVVALFQQTIAMLIFLGLNVHHALLRAVAASFDYLPVGPAQFSPSFTAAVLKIGGTVFALGTQIAAPVVAATLVADIVIGLMGKASPQMPLMLLGPAVKSMLGVAVLLGVLQYWPSLMERWFFNSFAYAERLLHLAR